MARRTQPSGSGYHEQSEDDQHDYDDDCVGALHVATAGHGLSSRTVIVVRVLRAIDSFSHIHLPVRFACGPREAFDRPLDPLSYAPLGTLADCPMMSHRRFAEGWAR